MEGVPWELFEVRGQGPAPVAEVFNAPAARKQRTRKPKDLALDTINERPIHHHKSSPDFGRDALSSSSDLGSPGSGGGEDGDGPKKVQKGQINALAKMLSALRR